MNAASPKRKALILLPEAAYPVMGGGPLRTASMLEFLADRFHLDAVHFRLQGEADPTALYPAGMLERTLLIDLPVHSKAFLPRLLRNLGRAARGVAPLLDRFSGAEAQIASFIAGQDYALAWCEHFWAAPYAPILRPVARKLVLDMHNVESQYFRTAAEHSSWQHRWLWRRFAQVAERMERSLLPQFDFVWATSRDDADRIEHLGSKHAVVIPNTIPRQARPHVVAEDSIAFSGNFAYTPNLDGMAWFAKYVWPQLFLTHPTLRFRVIGKEAELVSRLFTSLERVDIVGPVADAVEEIAKSKVAIAPLLVGSGTRLKILEAWAAGSAVVSTPLGAEGLVAQPGVHLEIASNARDFGERILSLLREEERRLRMAEAARATLESSYTWEKVYNLLSEQGL